jgi:hypothetical protein
MILQMKPLFRFVAISESALGFYSFLFVPKQAADDWKIERFLSEQVLPGGNYMFEIKRSECEGGVSIIRRIRFCSENGDLYQKLHLT